MPDEPQVTVVRRLTFEAPHAAGGERPYVLEVSATGPLDANGYVIDFFELKRVMEDAVAALEFPGSAERLVVACGRELEARLRPVRVTRVVLWETPNQGAEYHGE